MCSCTRSPVSRSPVARVSTCLGAGEGRGEGGVRRRRLHVKQLWPAAVRRHQTTTGATRRAFRRKQCGQHRCGCRPRGRGPHHKLLLHGVVLARAGHTLLHHRAILDLSAGVGRVRKARHGGSTHATADRARCRPGQQPLQPEDGRLCTRPGYFKRSRGSSSLPPASHERKPVVHMPAPFLPSFCTHPPTFVKYSSVGCSTTGCATSTTRSCGEQGMQRMGGRLDGIPC